VVPSRDIRRLLQQRECRETVVLEATISKTGVIENLRAVSGLPMLIGAAEDAVRTWRYRPYQLNGEAMAVETTINVVFRLGS
jgi:periplasmic protein TonB